MKLKNLKYILFPIIAVSIFAGCREDITPPGNPVTNINEPVQQRAFNSYTFSINAENVSFNLEEYPELHSSYSRLSLYVDDYISGIADIAIINENNIIIYSGRLEENLQDAYIDFVDELPSVIKISCRDFSGKLKIQLSAL